MPIVATVLKSGGEFDVAHLSHFVRELALFTQRWTRRNNFVPPRLVCLTDLDPETLPPGVEAIPMVDAWPEPWTVLELFKPGLFEEGEAVLYFRLDVDLVGDFINVLDAVDALVVNRLRADTVDQAAFYLEDTAGVAVKIDTSDSAGISVANASALETFDEDVLAVIDVTDSAGLSLGDVTTTLAVTVVTADGGALSTGDVMTTLRVTSASVDTTSAAITEARLLKALLARTDTPTALITEARAIFARLARTDAPAVAIAEHSTRLPAIDIGPWEYVSLGTDIGAWEYVP